MSEWLGILSQNSPETILSAGGVFVSLVAVTIAIRYMAVRYLTTYAARTQTRVDDIFLLLVKKANTLIIVLLAAFLAQKVLFVPEKLAQIFRLVAISGAFLQLALWGNAVITFLLTEATRRTDQQEINISARRAIAYFSRIILWLLIITLLLENLGVRLSPLLAGIGIGGVAVALAIQNILGDLFCYVAMILDKPFVAGDFLVIGDMMGTVERIGLKTTRIRSLSGELLIFANHDLADSRVRNYKTLRERRVVFKFGVTYETSIEKLKTIPSLVTSVFEAVPGCRLDRVHFAQLGDFSLNFEVVYYVLSGDYNTYMNLQQEINLRLMQVLGKEEVDFAYPTQTLYLHTGAQLHS
jgi:small-conductance mechanosensitive channel